MTIVTVTAQALQKWR